MTIEKINNIPDELKKYNQFIFWKYVKRKDSNKPTKVPYSPVTYGKASVTNPEHWASLEKCLEVFDERIHDGIGFVLTKEDPFCFIDFDNGDDPSILSQQKSIHEHFDSYSELSPSGKGLHIICKGSVPQGRKKPLAEIYSSERYMTMTGDVYNHKSVEDRSEVCLKLYNELTGDVDPTPVNIPTDRVSGSSDNLIIENMHQADNGAKVKDLWEGRWNLHYTSQSEADLSLINIIAFYSEDPEQVKRIFRMSHLGRRKKAYRDDYVDPMIAKSWDQKPPVLNLEELKKSAEVHNQEKKKKEDMPTEDNPYKINSPEDIDLDNLPDMYRRNKPAIPFPPGLVGQIAEYIYKASPRPIEEVAIAGAIGLMSGIAGKAYNVSNTGLNQYILLLGYTGVGKEAMARGIERLINSVRLQVPSASEFIGPADIASGQALLSYMDSISENFLSIVGEFGLKMKQICHPRATQAEITLRRVLLDLYNKSGKGDVVGATAYADKHKNTDSIQAPAFSILGETVPDSFFEAIDESLVAVGLVPRFLMIEYDGNRPPLNENHHDHAISSELFNSFGSFVANCSALKSRQQVIDVETDEEAKLYLRKIDKFMDYKMNMGAKEISRQLWNRGHLKTMKLAATVAVGINPYNPVIDINCVKWAYDIVAEDIDRLLKRFETGRFGTKGSEAEQITTVRERLKKYLDLPAKAFLNNTAVHPNMHQYRIITYAYIYRSLVNNPCFKNDRIGSGNAIKKMIGSLIDTGELTELSAKDISEQFGTRGKSYLINKLDL